MPGLTAAGIGALTYTGVKSWTGLSTANYAITPIALPHFGSPTIGDFVWAIAMGIAAAAVTFLIVQLARRTYPLVIRRALIATPVAGLAVAGLAIIFFEWTGKGENNVLFSGQSELGPLVTSAAGWSVGALVLLVIFKGLAWSVSMASFRGGPAFPALFIGAAGGIVASHLPGFSLAPAVAVGMAAMFVSMLGLPLSAIVLSAFLTASAGFTGISPLVIVGTVTAFLVTNLLTSLVPRMSPPRRRARHRRRQQATRRRCRTVPSGLGVLGFGCTRSRNAALGRANEETYDPADQDQVQEHLRRHDQTRRVGGRGDVAKADRREDRDGEIQRARMVEPLGERRARRIGHRQVDRREQDEEQRDDDTEGDGCAQLRETLPA